MDAIELRIHRENTAAYIAFKPSSISLIPVERTRTASGGYKETDLPSRPPQTFRIIELGSNQSPPIITLQDGKQRAASFWLLGLWDANVGINDHWTAADAREWQIGDIVRANGYEMRALVVERGA